MLSRRLSTHALLSFFDFLHGKQQHLLLSSSASLVLSILFVFRQQRNLSKHKEHFPGAAGAAASVVAPLSICPTVDTRSNDCSDITFAAFLPQHFIRFQQDGFSCSKLLIDAFDLLLQHLQHDKFFKRRHGIHNFDKHGVQHFEHLQQPRRSSASPFSDLILKKKRCKSLSLTRFLTHLLVKELKLMDKLV